MGTIKTEIYIETHEITVIKKKRRFFRSYCEYCEREVSLLSPDDAAALICCETEHIYSLMDAQKIHFRYFHNQLPFVCLRSVCLI